MLVGPARVGAVPVLLACVCIPLLSSALGGQTLVNDPSQAAQLTADFKSLPSGHKMSCRITLHLRTDSTFGVRAEYEVEAPADDFNGRHSWSTVARVVPQDQPDGAAFLVDAQAGRVSASGGARPFWGGWFWIGDGNYTVDLRVFDDRGRICPKEFHINAHSELKLSLPRGAVADMSAGTLAGQLKRDPRRHLKRLTLLLDAAPSSYTLKAYPLKLRQADRRTLLESVMAPLREIPADSVRLICFSLDQQSIVFRDDDFQLWSLDKLGNALAHVNFSTIDYSVISRPRGHLDLIAQLINGEIHASPPPGAVIFLGPQERFRDAIPSNELDGGQAVPRFFYLSWLLRPSTFPPDGSIAQAVSALHGKTFHYSDPESLLQAVDRIREDVLPQ
jgi:hypothetical protein